MPITKAISSLSNVKQLTGADSPQNPGSLVTYTYGPAVSTAGQTIINLGFSVSTTNTSNFLLHIDGKLMSLGSSNDYTFTNVQSNGTSSQVTMTQPLAANLNINAIYLGVLIPNAASTSILTLNSEIATLQSAVPTNALINGALDFWQRGTSVSVTNGSTTNSVVYQADRWWCNNNSGAAATYSQTAGVLSGSKFGASVIFGAATSNALGLVQVLENLSSLPFYNQTASFGVWVKAVGNVNQVTLGIQYSTSESKQTSLSTNVISSQTFAVNNATFTFCSLANVSIGTAMTTSGSLSVFIQPTGASTGNVYASGNGFVIEQASLNLGSVSMTFARCGRSNAEEFSMCQRYFEKLGSETTNTELGAGLSLSTTSAVAPISWQITKRAIPSVTFSSQTQFRYNNGTSNYVSTAVSAGSIGYRSFGITLTTSGITGGNVPGIFDTVSAAGFINIDADI
jgi:hypothetical protein